MSTVCARYKVRKFVPENAPHGRTDQWRYQCWVRRLYDHMFGPWLESFQEAQKLCEDHSQETMRGRAA
jgi:hypothetical protein